MVMRDVQLTGLYQEEAHNKGGGGDKERQHNAKAYTELYMLHRHGQVKKLLGHAALIGNIEMVRGTKQVIKF